MSQKLTITGNGDQAWTLLGSGGANVMASGTWGGGTLTLEAKNLQGNAVAITTYTADIIEQINTRSSLEVRWNLTGATTPSLDTSIID